MSHGHHGHRQEDGCLGTHDPRGVAPAAEAHHRGGRLGGGRLHGAAGHRGLALRGDEGGRQERTHRVPGPGRNGFNGFENGRRHLFYPFLGGFKIDLR